MLAGSSLWFFAFFIPEETHKTLAGWRRDLSLIADARRDLLDRRISDRVDDARFVATFPSVQALLSSDPHGSPGEGFPHVDAILADFRSVYGERSVSICDLAGVVIASSGQDGSGADLALAREAARTGGSRVDLIREPDGFIGFVVAVPIATKTAAGAVLVVGDARPLIFELLWRPVPGAVSSEADLIRKEGGSALYLSPLLFRGDAPLTYRMPLDAPGSARRVALDGESSFGSFLDYRNTPVLAATRALKGAPWGLVVKIDEAEAFAGQREVVRRRGLMGGVALLGLVAAAFGFWRSLVASHELALERSERRLGALLEEASGRAHESEVYFRSLIENSLDIMAVIDLDGRVRYLSPSIERTLGYRPEELVGRSVLELLHDEDRDRARVRLQQSFTTGSRFEHVLFRMRHRDGSWRTISAIGKPLLVASGPPGMILNARDLTESLQLESQLRQAQKMDAIGRLAGGIAHDFNNLLTVIQGYGELVRDSLEGDPRHESMRELLKATSRATSLTQQLLAFSRKQHLEPKVVSLPSVVRETGRMLERLIGEDIALSLVLSDERANVEADPGQIEQVVLNLAVNARDAMPEGGRLTISVDTVALTSPLEGFPSTVPTGRWVRITIQDTGSGMSAETLAHVFEPFFTTKERGKGTGLGLSTVDGIVSQSGGHVQVASVPHEGTTFRIYLPRTDAPSTTGTHAKFVSRPGTETILVVEDESAVRNLVRTVLEKNGYAVLAAEDGAQALAILEKHPGSIHVLLTDVVMPGMNGRELASLVTAARPKVKVILMSGYTADIPTDLGTEAGTPFLPKPFNERALTVKIREVLDAPAA